jgi:hypothetical protein
LGVGIKNTGVVIDKINSVTYERVKISVIISNLISFGFLASLLSIFFTSYDKTILKLEVAEEHFSNKN